MLILGGIISSIIGLTLMLGRRAIEPLSLDSKHRWAIETLKKYGLRNSPGLAASPGWESRALSLQQGAAGLILNISTDGNPMLWPHAREEYLSSNQRKYNPMPSDIKAFQFVITTNNSHQIVRILNQGRSVKLECYDEYYCLWRLSSHSSEMFSKSYAKFFADQADDRWRCLNTASNPMLPVLRRLRASIAP